MVDAGQHEHRVTGQGGVHGLLNRLTRRHHVGPVGGRGRGGTDERAEQRGRACEIRNMAFCHMPKARSASADYRPDAPFDGVSLRRGKYGLGPGTLRARAQPALVIGDRG
ncbi:hypothetical protein SSP24_65190 [Streptomyces spinoverrucosus]|uniref:Uncharacterized protein n=1 Tax=Streptomyces spinoverrucosus TaxID=284043 RepID=A0A4Y3VPM0_9ACTN|nr:hypothetical protein SSP24_65190 [Streptomyces spinoverrucosus]GHB44870.1 hypothetical protein GCM10010397_13210 [Streptomyces spinoverrucosus]